MSAIRTSLIASALGAGALAIGLWLGSPALAPGAQGIGGGVNAYRIRGVPIAATAPSNGQCLSYQLSPSQWQPGACGGTAVTLSTNGTANASQTALNLVAGTNVTLTNTSGGNVTVAATGGSGRTVVFSALNQNDVVTTTGTPFATIYTFPANTMCPAVGDVYDITISGTSSLSSGGNAAFDLGIALTRVLQNVFAANQSGGSGSWTAFEHITCAQIGASGVLIGQGGNYIRLGADFANVAVTPIVTAMNQDFTATVQITPLTQFTGTGSMTLKNFVIFLTQ